MTIARDRPGQGAVDATRLRARDAAIRRTRAIVIGAAAGAVGLSGLFSAVAAHAFKGRTQGVATAPSANRSRTSSMRVPGPDTIPPIVGDSAPLQPPEQPPAAPTAAPQPSSPAPVPQVSGGS
jgi:hypothetical protein